MVVRAERRATHADLMAVPDHKVAEILGGVLHVSRLPAAAYAHAAFRLGAMLGRAFDLGEEGPGGWHILGKPELHLGPRGKEDVLVPDLVGWRTGRLARLPPTAWIPVAPDWVCEVLSPRTEAIDRAVKLPIYAREGVRHVWLVNPLRRTLEVFALDPAHGRWWLRGVHSGDVRVRADPFAAFELNLAVVWPDVEPPLEPEEVDAPTAAARKAKASPAPPPRAKRRKRGV